MRPFAKVSAVKVSSVAALLCAALISLPAVPRAQSSTRSAAKDLTVERISGAPSLSGETLRGVAWAPDGRHLSYFRSAGDGMDLVVIDAATGQNHILVPAEKLRL